MESFVLFRHVPFSERIEIVASENVKALQRQRQAISREVEEAFAISRTPNSPKDNLRQQSCNLTKETAIVSGIEMSKDCVSPLFNSSNLLQLHAMHRRRLYLHYSQQLSHVTNAHYYKLLMWCHDNHLFIHPSVKIFRQYTEFRDHVFVVAGEVPRLTPLLAIPEHLAIGFKDPNTDDSDVVEQNNLYDAQRTREFHTMNSGVNATLDQDICEFFFNSLGMLVSDLITAKSSPLSDLRYCFADSLARLRTLLNAPYFEDDVVFSPNDPCLADVLLQMIRNYIRGGPLVNKIPMQELQSAVSICLSHSTPLRIGSLRSIGILPMVHAFPHGGEETNTYLVARTSCSRSCEKISAFFRHRFGYDFDSLYDGRWIYVVPDRLLCAGEQIRIQAMAPICDKDDLEAKQMWRLSCGSVPSSYKSTTEVSRRQTEITAEILSLGEKYLSQDEKKY